MSAAAILNALRKLDAGNDAHWTQEGFPRLETVKFLAGFEVTRGDVTAAAPGFVRGAALPTEGAAPVQSTTSATQETGDETVTAGGGERSGPADGSGSDGAVLPEEEPAAAGNEQLGLDARIADAERKLARMREWHNEWQREFDARTAELDALIIERDKATATTPHKGTTDIRQYLDSQQRQREERAARTAALKGIPLRDILPQAAAPLDQALRRKTQRGTQRPTF